MNVLVAGAGAMGCLFGAAFHKAGAGVLLVDIWTEHVDAINRHGLIVQSGEQQETIPVAACLPEAVDARPDLVVVFTKSHHTQSALQAVSSTFTDHTHVLTLQNGVGHVEIIQAFVPSARIIHGITTYPCDLLGPGRIHTQPEGTVQMMSVDGRRSPVLEQARQLLTAAGMRCDINPDVEVAIWEKLAFNSALNALSALLRLNVGQIGDSEKGRQMAFAIVEEVASVAHRKKIPVQSERIRATVQMAFEHHRDHQPSMLQDVLRQRRTEVDFINGAVLREAARFGLALPVNEAVCGLLQIVDAAHRR